MSGCSIFVSYSQKDTEWLGRVTTHLRALETQHGLEVWSDQELEAGDDWWRKLDLALDTARLALLLVSPDFLASRFIQEKEVARFLERQRQGELRIIPVLLRPSALGSAPWLTRLQIRPGRDRPLSALNDVECEKALARLTDEVGTLLERKVPASVPGLSSFLRLHGEQLRRLDWEESWLVDREQAWSEHRFTELEAEIEAEGRQRFPWNLLGASGRQGLRRERSLTDALEKSNEPFVVLEGPPGSGKSVALRHLAHELLKRARSTRNGSRPIPVYINLRGFRPQRAPDAEAVLSYVRESLGPAAPLFEKLYTGNPGPGSWLFLFDSFDEIPEVLSSTEADLVVKRYAEALSDFAHGAGNRRAIVASRAFRGPGRFGWPRFRILPLSEERRSEFLARNLETPALVDKALGWLMAVERSSFILGDNPLMLALLCGYVRTHGEPPPRPHALFESFARQRFERDTPWLEAKGLTPGQVRSETEAVAWCIAAEPALGLEPSRESLESALSARGLGMGNLPALLDELEELRLARGSARHWAKARPRTFSFIHRRFQEFFATAYVLHHPGVVSETELFRDYRWRETCVVLLQTREGAELDSLLAAAEAHIDVALEVTRPRENERPESFAWPPKALHVLGILQEGLAQRREELPAGFRQKVASLLGRANQDGTLLERREALEVSGILPSEELKGLLGSAFRSQSQWLAEAAFGQAAYLRELPPEIRAGITQHLAWLAFSGRLRESRRAVQAQLSRLHDASGFMQSLNLLVWRPRIRLLLFLAALIWGLALLGPSSPRVLETYGVLATLNLWVLWRMQEWFALSTLKQFRRTRGADSPDREQSERRVLKQLFDNFSGFSLGALQLYTWWVLGQLVGGPKPYLNGPEWLAPGLIAYLAYSLSEYALLTCLQGRRPSKWPLFPFLYHWLLVRPLFSLRPAVVARLLTRRLAPLLLLGMVCWWVFAVLPGVDGGNGGMETTPAYLWLFAAVLAVIFVPGMQIYLLPLLSLLALLVAVVAVISVLGVMIYLLPLLALLALLVPMRDALYLRRASPWWDGALGPGEFLKRLGTLRTNWALRRFLSLVRTRATVDPSTVPVLEVLVRRVDQERRSRPPPRRRRGFKIESPPPDWSPRTRARSALRRTGKKALPGSSAAPAKEQLPAGLESYLEEARIPLWLWSPDTLDALGELLFILRASRGPAPAGPPRSIEAHP